MTRIEHLPDSSDEHDNEQQRLESNSKMDSVGGIENNLGIDSFGSNPFIITNNNPSAYTNDSISFQTDHAAKDKYVDEYYDSNPIEEESEVSNEQHASGNRKWKVDPLNITGIQLTPQYIKQLCKQQNLYQTPHLNDKLYLHHKGFRTLDTGALKEYGNLKALWLEGNALKNLNGIEHMTQLRCLYAHQNLLEDIRALETLSDLRTLNLAQNRLTEIPFDSLSKWCPKLSNVNLSQNKFATVESIMDVTRLEQLSVLDLQDNKIEDESILEHLVNMKALSVLYLKGNPVVNKIKSYRKTLISKIKNLNYLDDRPVFEDERRLSMAWAAGGIQAEQEERKRMAEEKKDKEKRDLENFREWQKNARVKRLQRDQEEKMKQRIAALVRSMHFNFAEIAKVINNEFRDQNPGEGVELPVTDPNFVMEPYQEIDAEKCRQLFVEWKNYPYEKRETPASWSANQKKAYEDAEAQAI